MRSSVKLALAVATTAATLFGGSALASSNPNGNTTGTPAPCGTGTATVTVSGSKVLWPPNHKMHNYTVTYSGGAAGDTLTTTASSDDGKGVSTTDPQIATVQDTEDVFTVTGLRAERPGNGPG